MRQCLKNFNVVAASPKEGLEVFGQFRAVGARASAPRTRFRHGDLPRSAGASHCSLGAHQPRRVGSEAPSDRPGRILRPSPQRRGAIRVQAGLSSSRVLCLCRSSMHTLAQVRCTFFSQLLEWDNLATGSGPIDWAPAESRGGRMLDKSTPSRPAGPRQNGSFRVPFGRTRPASKATARASRLSFLFIVLRIHSPNNRSQQVQRKLALREPFWGVQRQDR